ncbi:MAG: NIPSNAP family protein [Balneolaceae bacterium]|nr:NIPSNAP family protein [Balneolaceae bacterium]
MSHYKLLSFIFILLFASILWMNVSGNISNHSDKIDADHHKVYELRTYTTFEGKLDDLHRRFADHTMALFEKHGMENLSYWTPMDKENTLIYIVAHDSREAAEKSWQDFRNDPEWQKAYEDSRKDGPIVEKVESVFMKKTDYSPM